MTGLDQRPAGHYYGAAKELDDDAFWRLILGKPAWQITAELTGGANLLDGKPTHQYADTHKHDLQMKEKPLSFIAIFV